MQIKSNMGRSVENNEQIKCIDDKEFEDTAMHSFLLLSKIDLRLCTFTAP